VVGMFSVRQIFDFRFVVDFIIYVSGIGVEIICMIIDQGVDIMHAIFGPISVIRFRKIHNFRLMYMYNVVYPVSSATTACIQLLVCKT